MLLALIAPLLVQDAAAATINVNAAGGADYKRIQYGINNSSDGDEIIVAAGTYEENVELRGHSNITIRSSDGSATTIVDGSAGTHCIDVSDAETGVHIEGFTLKGCEQGLQVRGTVVTAADITVKNIGGDSPGGGFLVTNGGDLTIETCVVKNVSLGANSYGGGFFVKDSALDATDCSITGNTAEQGGGAYVEGSTASFTDCVFDGNTSDSNGGGLRIRDASVVTATRVEVTSNVAAEQGGGWHLYDSRLNCQNCVVTDNAAGGAGGGVYINGMKGTVGSAFKGSLGEISRNATDGAGGGVHARSTDLEIRGLMDANTLSEPDSNNGAGLYFTGGDLTLSELEVSNHTANDGAGLYIPGNEGESLAFSDSSFTGNVASRDGGAMWIGGAVAMDFVDISGNEAGRYGGGVFAEDADMEVKDSAITTNISGVQGGGAKLHRSKAEFRRVDFWANESETGGGLHFHGAGASKTGVILYKCSIERNTAVKGGGVYAEGSEDWLTSRNTFADNSSEGLYIQDCPDFTTKYDFYYDNGAEGLFAVDVAGGQSLQSRVYGNGGDGVHYSAVSDHRIYNGIYSGNAESGVLIEAASGSVALFNSDAVANRKGVSIEYGSGVSLVNTCAAYNSDDGFYSLSSTPVLAYNNSANNGEDWGGSLDPMEGVDGNISEEPKYSNWSDDDNPYNDVLYLAAGSPNKNAGDPSLEDPDGSRSDIGVFGGPSAEDEDEDGDGYKPSDGDCNEDDPDIHPDADDAWYDGVDSDCSGNDDFDRDKDGFRHPDSGDPEELQDCDDRDATVYPGADDIPDDDIDQNCDGVDGEAPDDTGDTGGTDTPDDWWTDGDGDGFAPAQGDCDDDDAEISPDADEVCDDGIDNDCDEALDDLDLECAGSAECSGCAAQAGPSSWLMLAGLLLLVRRRD